MYSFSPAVLTAINQGRLGTVVVAILLPSLFTLLEKHRGLSNLSWRKIFSIVLIAAVAGAFFTTISIDLDYFPFISVFIHLPHLTKLASN